MLATTNLIPKDVSEYLLGEFSKNGNYKVCVKDEDFVDLEEQEKSFIRSARSRNSYFSFKRS